MWQLRLSGCIFLFRKISWHRPACLPQLSDGELTGNSPHFILTMGHGFLSAFIRRLWRIVCCCDRSLQTPAWNQRTGNSIRPELQISFVGIFLMVQFWRIYNSICVTSLTASCVCSVPISLIKALQMDMKNLLPQKVLLSNPPKKELFSVTR